MKSQHRLALLGLATGVLLALLLAPPSRWLVRAQALASIGRYHLLVDESDSDRTNARCQAAAARRPNDYALQYAAAAGKTNAETLAQLRALTAKFPRQPSLYANLLRYEMLGGFHLLRPEAAWLTGENTSKDYHPLPVTPQQFAVFDHEAAAGERLDPDNAYFPLMRAFGLFAAHRDAAGVEAVRRAGKKTVWREYLVEDVQSRWRLHQEAFGDPGAIPRAAISWSTWLPQYQGMHQAAVVTVAKAAQAEKSGRTQEGLELREAVRRCGDRMRVQSTFLVGPLVGSSLCALSCLRPGGAPPPKDAMKTENRPAAAAAYAAYAAYARRSGREDIAQAALAEQAAGARVTAIVAALSRDTRDLDGIKLLDDWWVADLLTLANVFWVLALGTAAAVSGRRTEVFTLWLRSWKTHVWHGLAAVALGCWLLVWALFLWNGWNWMLYGGPGMVWRVVLALAASTGLFVWALRRASAKTSAADKKGILKTMGRLLLAGFCVYCLSKLLAWQAHGIWDAWAVRRFFAQESASHDDYTTAADQAGGWLLGGILLVPLLTVFALAAAALIGRRPVLMFIIQGFRRSALPLASALLLVYGIFILGTLRQENAVSERLGQTLTRSGPYFAAQAGLTWPGPVK